MRLLDFFSRKNFFREKKTSKRVGHKLYLVPTNRYFTFAIG